MELDYKGFSYTIAQDEFESDDIFFKRAWFIVKQEPKTSTELEIAIHNSRLWSNLRFLNCKYSSTIESKIINLERKINN